MAVGSDLVVVTIETALGSSYVFPDMPRDMLDNVIKNSGWEAGAKVVLVNVSSAVLVLESRIVKSLSYAGEVRWPHG